jgi:hypothetical protein
MAERRAADARAGQQQLDEHIRQVARDGDGAASEIATAKALLDSGAIDEQEFVQLKQRALAL